jgi:FixJ family two-component response regulator
MRSCSIAKCPASQAAQLALHAKQMRLPVVMISGSPEAMKFAQENQFQLLHKPFRIADLLSAIEAAIASGEFGQREA